MRLYEFRTVIIDSILSSITGIWSVTLRFSKISVCLGYLDTVDF